MDERNRESQADRPGVLDAGDDGAVELQSQLLRRLIVGQTVAVSLLAAMTAIGGLVAPQSGLLALTPLGAVAAAVGLVSWFLLWRGRPRAASYVFLIGTAVAITSNVYVRGYEDASAIYYLWPILGAGALLEAWGGGLLAVVSAVLYLALVVLQRTGVFVAPMPYVAQQEVLLTVGSRVLMFFLLAFLGWLSSRNLVRALQQARRSGQELRALNETLEQRVEDRTNELERRTRYLEATSTVAQSATAVLDERQLVSRIVTLVSDEFDVYHAGLFLLDASGAWIELRAASSEGGQRMLERGHRLRVGEGIVGSVAQQGMHRIALDVDEDVAFRANPDLPETRSEMALPLRVRDQVIGVLDVQSTESLAFAQEDVTVLQALADQVSVAIDNARLFAQAQAALEAERSAYGELSRQQWQALLRAEPDLGYVSDAGGTAPADDLWEPQMEAALETGEATVGEANAATLSIPIRVRGQVVGIVDGRKPDGALWMPEEMELLQAMTEQLNVALEGARLYRETQRRAAQEQAIGQVTSSIRQSLELEVVLRTAAEQIRDALGLGKAVVRLAVPERVLTDGSDDGEQE